MGINVVGAFALGVVVATDPGARTLTVVGAGLLGNLTTYSTFALEATEAGFEVGTRTLVDVLDNQRDLFRARRDLAVSRYDYILNYLSLLQAAGTLGDEDVSKANAWLAEVSS